MLDMNNTKNFHMGLDPDISHGAGHNYIGYDGEDCF
jgi:hypothetical protein